MSTLGATGPTAAAAVCDMATLPEGAAGVTNLAATDFSPKADGAGPDTRSNIRLKLETQKNIAGRKGTS